MFCFCDWTDSTWGLTILFTNWIRIVFFFFLCFLTKLWKPSTRGYDFSPHAVFVIFTLVPVGSNTWIHRSRCAVRHRRRLKYRTDFTLKLTSCNSVLTRLASRETGNSISYPLALWKYDDCAITRDVFYEKRTDHDRNGRSYVYVCFFGDLFARRTYASGSPVKARALVHVRRVYVHCNIVPDGNTVIPFEWRTDVRSQNKHGI